MDIKDPQALVEAIDNVLAHDGEQLQRFQQQADAVQDAYADLLRRLRREIELSKSGGAGGASCLRG